jgi:hypothetical protein
LLRRVRMPRVVRFRHHGYDVTVFGAFRASSAERAAAMAPFDAAHAARVWCMFGLAERTLRELEALVVDGPARRARQSEPRDVVAGRLVAAMMSGRLLVVTRPERRLPVAHVDEPDVAVLGPADVEPQRVDFVFALSDGTPISGVDYVLVDDTGARSPGKLGKDGAVGRSNAIGTYAVALKEVDLVEWERPKIFPKDTARMSARLTGIDDGAQGKLEIFKLYAEGAKDVLATASIAVADGRATGTWTYDEKIAGPLGADGSSAFIAQLSFEGGKIWKKSEPLQVRTFAIASLAWSRPSVLPGDSIDLVIKTLGFSDAATVSVAPVRHDFVGEGDALGGPRTVTLAGGSATLTLTCGDGADLPARPGDVCARVTVKEDGVEQAEVAPLLWVDLSPPEPAPLSSDTDDANDDSDSDAGDDADDDAPAPAGGDAGSAAA